MILYCSYLKTQLKQAAAFTIRNGIWQMKLIKELLQKIHF